MSKLPYIPYTVSSKPWDPDELGNHRAAIDVTSSDPVVRTRVPWRRRDKDPAEKRMLLYSWKGTEVHDYLPIEILSAYGDIIFAAVDGPGTYFLYFLPYEGEVKIPYPKATYLSPELTESEWRDRYASADQTQIPEAAVRALECVDEFNMFTEMELIANEAEVAALYEKHREDGFLVFPEYRESSIRMFGALPHCWAKDGPRESLKQTVHRGETYVFQLGVHAHQRPIENVEITFEKLTTEDGRVAAEISDMRCFNTDGTAWDGSKLTFDVTTDIGRVQPMWCAIDIHENAAPGAYATFVTISGNGEQKTVQLHLDVIDELIPHHGDDNSDFLSRLRWLDSTLGTEDEIIPPFTPVELSGKTVSILGRDVEISETGLPAQVTSYFSDDLNSVTDKSFPLLSGPMLLDVITDEGKAIQFSQKSMDIIEHGTSFVRWKVVSEAAPMRLTISATMEFDGTIEYEMHLQTQSDIDIKDIRFTSSLCKRAAQFMTGLGRKGGSTPDEFSWKWDPEFNQDAVWIGAINGGIQYTFKDKNYSRPLNTNFYQLKPLNMPTSWANEKNGRVTLHKTEGEYLLTCSSGARTMKSGTSLDFDMRLLISPFKPIETANHFGSRYFHQYLPIDDIRSSGANTINIHHCTDINPYINYPFLTPDDMKVYVDEAHKKDCKVKLYYTVRELTTRTPEIFALKSLGHEIFVDGEGGGHAWLQEHLDDGYIAAWYAIGKRDTSAINGVLSRWHNFYVEGLNWLAENIKIDGVYIDDLGFGREIMKRVRRILHRHRAKPIIDLHSANQYNEKDGFSSSANLYMEHFPFLDRLWFGEYFDYNEKPDYWLVEISGLPFGLMGEMLQDGGNLWRGMVFGMTGRMPRVMANQALWRMWDTYGLPQAKMVGFWSESCSVSVNHDDVKATVYCGKEYTVISVASWADKETTVHLNIDWAQLGLDQDKTSVFAPSIDGFQEEEQSIDNYDVTLELGKGKLIVISHA